MEDESRVFGFNTNDSEKHETKEFFDFFRKDETKKDVEKSANDLTDFIDSLIQDTPDPSEEEVNAGIEKILARTHPTEIPSESKKSTNIKKVTLKVLFIAAVLSLFSVFCIYVAGSSNNISIENGFVTFAKDTIKIVFFGEDTEDYISVDSLLTNLEEHGYVNIVFPQEFVTKSDKYMVSVPTYADGELKQVSFDIYNDHSRHSFNINCIKNQQILDYTNLKNVQSFDVNGICMYLFENNNNFTIEFINNGYHYYIVANDSIDDILCLMETIK